jgi:protein TonB
MTSRTLSPLGVSSSIHALILGGVGLILVLERQPELVQIPLEVIQTPKLSDSAVLTPRALPKPIEKPKVEARKIFGATRGAQTSTASDLAVKAGNTVAKTPDQERLRPEDEQALPIPADEFLVTAMPKLLADRRVPYPPEAKKAGVQGAVVFDLLIDAAGKVREARLVQGPGFGLNEAAAAAVVELRFEPARVEEKPVAVRIRYAYRFVLEKS